MPFVVAPNQALYVNFASVVVDADDFTLFFQAQTAGAAYVSFLVTNATQTHKRDDNCYEVVIGGWKNARSAIRFGNQGKTLASANTYQFNSPTHMSWYWIAMHAKEIAVGRGKDAFKQTFLRTRAPKLQGNPRHLFIGFAALDVPAMYSYNIARFESPASSAPRTRAPPASAPMLDLRAEQSSVVFPGDVFLAPGNRGLYSQFANFTVESQKFSFIFHAQTDESAWVSFLTSSHLQSAHDENGYEIGIGADSSIRFGNQGRELFKLSTPRFNSRSIMRTFWIRLDQRVLSVGRGDQVGSRQFMAAGVPPLRGNPARLYIGFAGWTGPVAFVFGISERAALGLHVVLPDRSSTTSGSVLTLQHRETAPNRPFKALPNQGMYVRFSNYTVDAEEFAFTFQAKTAGAVLVCFATSDAPQTAPDPNAYEIVIGGWRNSQSVIRLGSGESGIVLISKVTHYFNTDVRFQFYWVALSGGVLSVGQGDRIGAGVFMRTRVPRLDGRPEELFAGFASFDYPVVYVYDFHIGNCCAS